MDRAAFDRAKTWYEQAIAADPAYALAMARLAENRMQVHWFMGKLDHAQLESVKTQAEQAIELAPNLAQTYVALGVCYYYGYRDYERALASFNKAIELQPNNSSALEYSGYVIDDKVSGNNLCKSWNKFLSGTPEMQLSRATCQHIRRTPHVERNR